MNDLRTSENIGPLIVVLAVVLMAAFSLLERFVPAR